jgi:hypothetical protein
MSPRLDELIRQAESLPVEEQLELIARLAQQLSNETQLAKNSDQAGYAPMSQEKTRTGKSIWQIADSFVKDLSEEELGKLPNDGAVQHDHYIYGLPKAIA